MAHAQSIKAFREAQYKSPRVAKARAKYAATVKQLLEKAGLSTNANLFIRAFKHEKVLEVWAAKNEPNARFQLLKTYPVCEIAGTFGPKRTEGDDQVPEGFYVLDRFNPQSTYHLSMGINYPNASDQYFGKQPYGSNIFIHGKCVTIGCLPLTDPLIEELYVLVLEANQVHQNGVPVHIFPCKFSAENRAEIVRAYQEFSEGTAPSKDLLKFWDNLQEGYSYFERNKKLPKVSVAGNGKYVFE